MASLRSLLPQDLCELIRAYATAHASLTCSHCATPLLIDEPTPVMGRNEVLSYLASHDGLYVRTQSGHLRWAPRSTDHRPQALCHDMLTRTNACGVLSTPGNLFRYVGINALVYDNVPSVMHEVTPFTHLRGRPFCLECTALAKSFRQWNACVRAQRSDHEAVES
jgi:hypothetical protein